MLLMLNYLVLNCTNMKEMEKYISETLPYLLFKISKHIDVGASKFLGVQRNFAQTCPKSYCATFTDRFCGVASTKMAFTCFCANLGRRFSMSNNVGCRFYQIFRDFA